jgi:transposase InsO family protein
MRTAGLRAHVPQAFLCKVGLGHEHPIALNLLARRDAITDHPVRNRAWVGDTTYIPTRSGWLVLAVLSDLASRMVMGWATSASMATACPAARHRASATGRGIERAHESRKSICVRRVPRRSGAAADATGHEPKGGPLG